MPPPKRSCPRRPPSGTPPPGRPSRRLTTTAAAGRHGTMGSHRPTDVLAELEVLDEIAKRVSGSMVNAGIASIDRAWTDGEDLNPHLQTFRSLARRASPQFTGGLWTLIAWIHWRTGNRAEVWPALQLAMRLDDDIDAAHYLTVFMHHWADPHKVPPVT